MTPSNLKYNYETKVGGHFFERSSMKFFGDTMSNYGCCSSTYEGQQVWELHRKRPVKFNLQDSSFFNKETFERVL
jgi:hypothetical protein